MGKKRKKSEAAPPAAPSPAALGSVTLTAAEIAGAGAPFIYMDNAPSAGHLNGIIQVTLDAIRLVPRESRPLSERVIVGHLRMNVAGAKSLIATLQAAVRLAERSPDTIS